LISKNSWVTWSKTNNTKCSRLFYDTFFNNSNGNNNNMTLPMMWHLTKNPIMNSWYLSSRRTPFQITHRWPQTVTRSNLSNTTISCANSTIRNQMNIETRRILVKAHLTSSLHHRQQVILSRLVHRISGRRIQLRLACRLWVGLIARLRRLASWCIYLLVILLWHLSSVWICLS